MDARAPIGRACMRSRDARGALRWSFSLAPLHTLLSAAGLSAHSFLWNLEDLSHLQEAAAVVMDATIYEIIFGELGDLNCSLVEAFHDTFLENASLSLLSADGKVKLISLFCAK